MSIKVLVVDDRVHSAQALGDAHALDGCEVTIAGSWVEAADTLAYQQLANTPPPALLIGPLSKDAIDSLSNLRRQGIDPPAVLYTENRSHDQDTVLIAQYQLRTILHKPFSAADRARLLGGGDDGLDLAPLTEVAPLGSADAATSALRGQAVEVPLPPAPAGRTRMRTPPLGTGAPAGRDFDDLTGSSRSSSVREPPPRRQAPGADLPTGVQRLLQDYGGPEAPAAAKATTPASAASERLPARPGATAPQAAEPEGRRRLEEPRSISIVIVDDRFGTAALLVERCGAAGQRCHVAPTYVEALIWLERLMSSPMGCELVVGPLSADGVSAVREYRKRSWPTHTVFYTESATQSQDARLQLQYGCMTILRRAGMSEPLEKLITELRWHARVPPAQPQDHVRGARTTGTAATTASGLHQAPAAPGVPATRTVATAPAAAPAKAGSDGRLVPPTTSDAQHGAPSRIRRSVLPPAVSEEGRQAPLSIDVPLDAHHPTRVVTCQSCRQEFVVAASVNLPVRCPHCQAVTRLT